MAKFSLLNIFFQLQIICYVVSSHENNAKEDVQRHQHDNWPSHPQDSSLFLSKIFSRFFQKEETLISALKHLKWENKTNLLKIESNNGLKNLLKNISSKYFSNSSSRDDDELKNVATNSTLLSKRCRNGLDGLFKLLIDGKYLKIEQMLDAMGKPGSGVYQGNLLWLGSYQECQATDDSHYCTSLISVKSMNIMLGLCVPKECQDRDTLIILQTIASVARKATGSKNAMNVDENNILKQTYGSPVICQKDAHYSAGTIVAFVITALLAMLVMLSTCFDYLIGAMNPKLLHVSKSNGFMPVNEMTNASLEEDDEQPLLAQNDIKTRQRSLIVDVLLCFSLRKNASAILNTNAPPNAITSINGIRTLSMFWVILGHTFFFALYAGSDNIIQGFKIVHRLSFQAVANAYFSVDTFFVLSGLLVSYLCLRRFDNFNGYSFTRYFTAKFLPLYYLHRFLRLTPSYMYVILFYIFIYPFCGHGPLWFEQAQGPAIQYCKDNWWTNLLYINNFYPTSMGKECIGWSWYLANDMQFYIISPIILLVMFQFGLLGAFGMNVIICVLSFLATGLIIGTQHLNALLTGDFQAAGAGLQAQHFADWVYSKPYCRIPPYLVGLFLGFLLHHRKAPKGSVRHIICIVGWAAAILVGLLVTYGPYTVFKTGGRPFTEAENVLYGTFSRFAWGLCVAWVIYACHFDMGGPINSILSWKAFIPLSRLTYSAYLIHPIIIYVFYSSLEKPFHFADISIAYYYASFLLMTYSAAFLLAAAVEFPAMNLEKLAFRF